jgi:broad specificity phosphatase PhoE
VYSSDLLRALETADAVASRLGLQAQVRPALREMHFGEWEGLSWNQIARRYPKLSALWVERFPRQSIPGAESLRQFQKRIAAGIREVVEANRGQSVVIVTHAGVIRFTLGKILGLPARKVFQLAQNSCALNVIEYSQDGVVVRCVNG